MRFPWPWNDVVDRCEVIVSELFEAQRLTADSVGEALRAANEARDLKDRILAQEVVIKDLQRRLRVLEKPPESPVDPGFMPKKKGAA